MFIQASWVNEWFAGLAKVAEKATGNKVVIPHIILPMAKMDSKVIKENYDAIAKAYEEK